MFYHRSVCGAKARIPLLDCYRATKDDKLLGRCGPGRILEDGARNTYKIACSFSKKRINIFERTHAARNDDRQVNRLLDAVVISAK